MPREPKKRKWALFGNHGVKHALDLDKVTRVELSTLAVAGELDPPERLRLYAGGGEPLTVVGQEEYVGDWTLNLEKDIG